MNLGLCSVTLRAHSIDEVIAAKVAAGLTGIEWGTDVHVTDAASADYARVACAAAGVQVLSLGSYYRAGSFGNFDDVVALAVRAGAPRIRIWAGELEPEAASSEDWQAVITDTQRIAALAAEHELQLAFEFHSGSLTATAPSTLELLDRVNRSNVGSYWQPPVGVSDQEALASLHTMLDRVLGIHCFSWWPATERLALAERAGLWHAVFSVVRGRGIDAMLEFVTEDLPGNVVRDGRFLAALSADKNPA